MRNTRSERRQQTKKESQAKAVRIFKNKYPFNLLKLLCLLKTLMKQFFKLKCFIFEKYQIFVPLALAFTVSALLLKAEENDKLVEINSDFRGPVSLTDVLCWQ